MAENNPRHERERRRIRHESPPGLPTAVWVAAVLAALVVVVAVPVGFWYLATAPQREADRIEAEIQRRIDAELAEREAMTPQQREAADALRREQVAREREAESRAAWQKTADGVLAGLTRPPAGIADPEPEAVAAPAVPPEVTRGRFRYRVLQHDHNGRGQRTDDPDQQTVDACWDADGRLHRLSASGVVTTHRDDGGVRRVRLGLPGRVLHLTAGGLLVTSSEGTAALLDPASLRVVRKIRLPVSAFAASSPKSRHVYAFGEADLGRSRQFGVLVRADTAGGPPTALDTRLIDYGRNSRSDSPTAGALSPDGRHLFYVAGGRLCRGRLDADLLTQEQATDDRDDLPTFGRLFLSRDGRHVYYPAAVGGEYRPVFAAADFAAEVPPPVGDVPGFVAEVDPAGGRFYRYDHEADLIVYGAGRKRLGAATVIDTGSPTGSRRIVADPRDGGRVAVLKETALLLVTVPKG